MNLFTLLSSIYPEKMSSMFRQLINRKYGQGTGFVYFRVNHIIGNECVVICTFL